MHEFSRIKRLPPYVFNITNELKMNARRRGEDVIDLSMGNPDGPTPQHIVDKLVEAAQRQDTHGYSVSKGIPRLRRAISTWYQRRYGVELDPDSEAIVTIGSKEGLAHLMLACLERGDTVLVPNPSYPIHIYGAIIAGADIRSVRMTPGVDFFAELERAIRELTPKPKMLVIGFPSNPTAQCVELEFFERIVALARQQQASSWCTTWPMPTSCSTITRRTSIMQVPGAREVAVEFFTMSKSYNMAGWRIGFMVGNKELVHALARIKSYHDYGSFTPIQVASIVAPRGAAGLRRGNQEDYQKAQGRDGEGAARHRLDGRGAPGLDVHLGEDPRRLRGLGSIEFTRACSRGRRSRWRRASASATTATTTCASPSSRTSTACARPCAAFATCSERTGLLRGAA
jgi:alanine-synthesizing transaminase